MSDVQSSELMPPIYERGGDSMCFAADVRLALSEVLRQREEATRREVEALNNLAAAKIREQQERERADAIESGRFTDGDETDIQARLLRVTQSLRMEAAQQDEVGETERQRRISAEARAVMLTVKCATARNCAEALRAEAGWQATWPLPWERSSASASTTEET